MLKPSTYSKSTSTIFGVLVFGSPLELKPDLKFVILGNTTVYDIREDVPNLDILFDQVSIKQSGLTLSMVTVKVINEGNQGITKAAHDDLAPLGIVVEPGKIINAEVIDASDGYLKENLSLKIQGTNQLIISPLIFDAGESFSIKTLVLHNKSIAPSVTATGKISGIKSIKIDPAYKSVGKRVWWREALAGGFWIQFSRFFGYGLAFLALLICFISSVVTISDIQSKKRKAKRLDKIFEVFQQAEAVKGKHLQTLKAFYARWDDQGIELIHHLLLNETELSNEIERFNAEHMHTKDHFFPPEPKNPHFVRWISKNRVIKALIEYEVVSYENKKLSIDTDFIQALGAFINFRKEMEPKYSRAAKWQPVT